MQLQKDSVRGLSGALNDRQQTKKLPMYSKQWEPGDTLRVFYRVFQYEDTEQWNFLSGDCRGYRVNDMKALGLQTSFIPALCKFDENGKPVGAPDIAYRFSYMAPLFVKGQLADEKAAVLKKPGLTDAMKFEALKQIELKYDTKNNMQAVRPVIGYADSLIVLEAICVPFKDNKPSYESLPVVMQPISNVLGRRLLSILNNPQFTPNNGENWLEIEYIYPLADSKAESGKQVVPVGVDAVHRLSVQHPQAWVDVQSAMCAMSETSDMIIRRSTSAISETRIIKALSSYTIINSQNLESCMLDDDLTGNFESSAGVIHDLNLSNVFTDPKVIEILAKSKEEREKLEAQSDLVPAKETVESTELPADIAGVPTIDNLLKESDVSDDESFFDNIDLAGAMGEGMA